MSKEFFSVLGDELCSIKNSPFYKLGQKPTGLDDHNIRRSQLSYDPDRLFNTQRFQQKLEAIEEKDFIQMKQQEKREEQRIEFQLLKEATREDFQRKVKELRLRNDEQTAPKQFTIFKSLRSFCTACRKCATYRGNFGKHPLPWPADPTKSVQFLGCLHCRCPMNAHELVRPLPQRRKEVWSYMKSKRMREQYLNVQYFVAAFTVGEGKPEEQMMEVAELLEKVGFRLRNYQVADKWKLEMGLLRVGLLLQSENPAAQETTMRLQQCIAEAGKWSDVTGEQFQEYLLILKKIDAQFHSKLMTTLREDDPVLLFLIQTDNFSPSQQKSLIQSLEQYINPSKLAYLSADKREAVLLSQQIFPQEFTINKRMFLLPQADSQQNLQRFRDIIDYNGYSILFDKVRNIKRTAAQNMLNFLNYHQVSYIIGKEFASQTIPQLPILFTAKTGPQHLHHYGTIPSFLEIPQQKHEQITKQLLPDYGHGQRCVIVLRPLLAGSGFEQMVVNLLRVNNFTIIQRTRGALSLECAQYLSALQHINEQQREDYLSLLTTGVCQILLVSKKSALYDAHVLLNRCQRSLADINPRWIRNRPFAQIKRGRQVFKEQFSLPEIRNNLDIFCGGSSLLNISNCLFGPNCEGKVRVLQNCRTGQFIKIGEQSEQKDVMKCTLRQREQILGQLKKNNFNYLLFNSKSQKTTQELASLFFPQCTLFESTVVIVKPSYLHLLPEIKQTLNVLRYHIIFTKTVQLSRQFAQELILDLQKLKMDHETLREATQLYAGQKIAFLCVSKLSARKELLFLLSNFSFLPTRTIIVSDESQQFLKEVLVPIWNNEQRYLKVFNRHLSNLEEAAILLTQEAEGRFTAQDKQQLTEYFVGSIFGTRPDAQGSTTIGKLSLYCTEQQLAKFQSWYYATLSNHFPNSVPLLFQYRLYGKTTLVVQSHSGEPFMACIINHFNEERKQQQKSRMSSNLDGEKVRKRNSISLLLWAKKIFKFVQELSKLDPQSADIPIEIEGWGRIIHHNNQYRAELNESQSIAQDKRFLQNIITKYASNRHITTNCKKMIESRVLPQRYKFENRRLLPQFDSNNIEDAFRVVQRGDVSKLYLQGQFEMLDPDNQKNTTTRSLLALNLYRICPHVATRYSLLAQMLLFFEKWQQESLDHREVFSDILEHLYNFIGKYQDLQFLEFQIYMHQLQQLMREEITEDRLRAYPSLRKGRARGGEQVVGKNRKFLDQKQYFRPSQQQNQDALEQLRLKYMNFDLKTLQQAPQNHILNLKEDVLHNHWMNQKNIVNLLREDPNIKSNNNEHRGVYVEYEKVLNENEEKVKGQLQGQVQKLGNHREETVLRDRGLDDELWYRRVRSGIGKNGKVDQAISKQLQKLNKFKAAQSTNQTA